MNEVYVSVDVETDGPIPGENSMLSIGAVAYDQHGTELAAYSVHIKELQGAHIDMHTMRWWGEHKLVWDALHTNQVDAVSAMTEFSQWLAGLPGRPVCVAYPAGFDFTFIKWYLIKFTGTCIFGLSAIDIKTMAWAAMGGPFKHTVKYNMPAEWLAGLPAHTHDALDDAREQGQLFFRIRKAIMLRMTCDDCVRG